MNLIKLLVETLPLTALRLAHSLHQHTSQHRAAMDIASDVLPTGYRARMTTHDSPPSTSTGSRGQRLARTRLFVIIDAEITELQRRLNAKRDVPSRPATGMGGMYLVAVGGAFIVAASMLSVILVRNIEVRSGVGPFLGAHVLAWLAQSVVILGVSTGVFAVLHGVFSLGRLDDTLGSRALLMKLGRASFASMRRVAEKSGVVVACLTLGTVLAVAALPTTSSAAGEGRSVLGDLASAQLGAGLAALVVIVLYETIRTLEDLLRGAPPISRTFLIFMLSSVVAVVITTATPFRADLLVGNLLSSWVATAGYAPMSPAEFTASIQSQVWVLPEWGVAVVMATLLAFRLWWLRLTRPDRGVQ